MYTDVNGCDSLMTLNLTINNSSSGSVELQHVMIYMGWSCL